MDVVEKIERLKNKEEEILKLSNHIKIFKINMKKMTKEEELILSYLEERLDNRLTSIHEKLDDIYEIINLANEL